MQGSPHIHRRDGTGQDRSPRCPPGVTEVGYFFSADDRIVAEVAQLWAGGTPNDPEHFQITSDGVAAFEIRRRNSYVPIGGNMASGCYVGGELQMATVSARSVETAAIYRWPDKVGHLIDQKRRPLIARSSR